MGFARQPAAGPSRLPGSIEPIQGLRRIEVDRLGEGPYLGAPVESARHNSQIISFKRLEMASGDPGLV
jgi:hypothetical protein